MSGDVQEVSAGLSQAYIDTLTENVKAAALQANEFAKAATKAKAEYQLARAHYEDLENLYDRLEDTYELADQLDVFIQSLQVHAGKVCTNVGHSRTALGILMECLTCLSVDTERLEWMLKQLVEAIDQLNDPNLNPNNGLIKCITDLRAEVTKACGLHKTAVQATIDLLRCVMDMEFMICEKPGEEGIHGLVADLKELYRVLCCEYPGGNADWEIPDPEDAEDLEKCCEGNLSNGEIPPFRDCQDELSEPAMCEDGKKRLATSLILNLKDKRDEAKILADFLKCAWQYYQQKQRGAAAKRDAAQKGLDAAKKAKALCN